MSLKSYTTPLAGIAMSDAIKEDIEKDKILVIEDTDEKEKGITIQESIEQDRTILYRNYHPELVTTEVWHPMDTVPVGPKEYGMNNRSRRSRYGNKW